MYIISFINSNIVISLILLFFSEFSYISSLYADTIENVRYYHVSNDRIVIYYDLIGSEKASISVRVSWDGGASYTDEPLNLSGDVGDDVTAGPNKRIVWELENGIDRLPDGFLIQVVTDTLHLLFSLPMKKKKHLLPVVSQLP